MRNSKLFKKNVALLLALLFLCMSLFSCNQTVTTGQSAEPTPSHKETANGSDGSSLPPSAGENTLPSSASSESRKQTSGSVSSEDPPTPSAEPVDPSPTPTPSLSNGNGFIDPAYVMMQDTLNDIWLEYDEWVANAHLCSVDIPNRSKSIFCRAVNGVRLTWYVWSEWGFADKNFMEDEYEIVLCYRQSPKGNSDKEDRWFCIEKVDSCYVGGVEGWCHMEPDVTNLAFVDVLEEWCAEKDEVEVEIQMWILCDDGPDSKKTDAFYTKSGGVSASGVVEGILETTIEIDKESLSQAKEWIKEFHSESDQSD